MTTKPSAPTPAVDMPVADPALVLVEAERRRIRLCPNPLNTSTLLMVTPRARITDEESTWLRSAAAAMVEHFRQTTTPISPNPRARMAALLLALRAPGGRTWARRCRRVWHESRARWADELNISISAAGRWAEAAVCDYLRGNP